MVSDVEVDKFGQLFHFSVIFKVNILRQTNLEKEIIFRDKKNFNADQFLNTCYNELLTAEEDLCCCPSSPDLLKKKDCINCFCELYNKIFSENFDRACPRKIKKIKLDKDPPWLNNEVKIARKERRRKETAWRRCKTAENRLAYCEARNHVCRLIQQAKKQYYNNKIKEYSTDTKQLNFLLNDISGKKEEVILPACDNDTDLADKFADFFDKKIENIIQQLNTPDTPMANSTDGSDDQHTPVLLADFEPISESEVKKILLKANPSVNSKDPFPISMVKNSSKLDCLIKIFSHIINLSWKQNKFPDSEKIGIIKPLYKGEGNANELKFYRPVTTLSFLSKVIEKAMLVQLNKFLYDQKILPDMQSAYRELHSTETTVCAVIDDLLLNLDKGKCSILFLLDLSAAFDTVDHDALLQDLKNIGLGTNIVAWFSSYLKDRKYKIQINDKFSKIRNLNRGVPQGSVGGPYLFLIYTRGLSQLLHDKGISHKLFADDTQGLHVIEDYTSDVNKVIEVILACKDWLKRKLQKLNEDKTKIIIIGSKIAVQRLKTLHNIDSVSINGYEVELCDNVKNLGVFVDETLSLKKQILQVVKTSNHQLKNIAYIRKYLTRESLKILAVQQILSRIDYCNSLYHNLPQYHLKKLQILMHKAARLIHHVPFGEHMSPFLIQLHWLPVKARICYKICCLVQKAIHHGYPTYLRTKLKQLTYNEGANTRNSGDPFRLEQPYARGSSGARSFSYAAPRIFNKLPLDLRQIGNTASFKKRLKTFFFSAAYDLETQTTADEYKL